MTLPVLACGRGRKTRSSSTSKSRTGNLETSKKHINPRKFDTVASLHGSGLEKTERDYADERIYGLVIPCGVSHPEIHESV